MADNNSLITEYMNKYISTSINIKPTRGEEIRQLCLKTRPLAENKDSNTTEINGWKVDKVLPSKADKYHFGAVIYKKENEVCVCFAGTDPKNYKDQAANVKMGLFDLPTKQMLIAAKYIKKIQKEYDYCTKAITLAGHSEGGSEGIYCGLLFDLPTYTYNPFFLGNKTLKSILKERKGIPYNTNLITNYRSNLDPVSKLINKDIGRTFIVENSNIDFKVATPIGTVKAHSIENMGNCDEGIAKATYMRTHKEFLDKFLDLKLTNKSLSNINDCDLWTLTEAKSWIKFKRRKFIQNLI